MNWSQFLNEHSSWSGIHRPNPSTITWSGKISIGGMCTSAQRGVTVVSQRETHPGKFNSKFSPEKWWLEDFFPIGKVTFLRGELLNFGRVSIQKASDIDMFFFEKLLCTSERSST